MHKMIPRLLQEACPRRHGLQKPAVMFKVCRYIVITSAPLATCLIVLSSTRRLAEGMPGLCAKPTAVGRGWKARRPWKGTRKMSTLVRSIGQSVLTGLPLPRLWDLFFILLCAEASHCAHLTCLRVSLNTEHCFPSCLINHHCKPSSRLAALVTQVYCLISSLI